MNRLQNIPFYPLLFAIYPVLALLSVNIHEVSASIVWRPLLVISGAVIVMLLLLRLILRDWGKAALISFWIILVFFSYGHLYDYLRSTPLAEAGIVRHRYLSLLFLFLLVTAVWFTVQRVRNFKPATGILNLASIVLVAIPLVQIGAYQFKASSGEQAVEAGAKGTSLLSFDTQSKMPDVYYIILDTYTRSDVMASDLEFDNSDFIHQLEALGFYVSGCSRSNYNNTVYSIVTSLNMSYLPELIAESALKGIPESDIWMLIKPNLVRRNFEQLGYEFVTFDTGYKWNNIDNSDLYLSRSRNSFSIQFINPFEQMLIDSTAISIFSDYMYKTTRVKYSGYSHPLANYIGQEEFILDRLPQVALLSEPTFTYVHINIPHSPFVFTPGGYQTDPDYWSGPYMNAVDKAHFRSGYIQSVEYINARILDIIREILQKSGTPPIIILQGDHGYWGDSGGIFPILNAYYLPGVRYQALYPTISPVNTFRLIFNEYFGGKYEYLPDESFDIYAISVPLPEDSPACQQ